MAVGPFSRGDSVPAEPRSVATIVPTFLCPSDDFTLSFLASNYVACGGIPTETRCRQRCRWSLHAVNSDVVSNRAHVPAVTDGLSNTVAFSESCLVPHCTRRATDAPSFCKDVTALSQASCDASTVLTDRGALWADGAHNDGLYNNVRTPNSPLMDCAALEPGGRPRVGTPAA